MSRRDQAVGEGPSSGDAKTAEPDPLSLAVPAGLRRNTVFALLAQLTTGMFTAVLMLYLVRALGPEGFGVFALALGIGNMALLVADFGVPHSVARYLAESREDREATVALVRDAVRLKLLTAAFVAACLFALAGPIASAYDQPELTWPLRGVALALFAESVMTLFLSVFIAVGRIAVNLRIIFAESLMETIASVALVVLGAGAAGAMFGRALGYGFGAIFACWIVVRFFGRSSVGLFGAGSGQTRVLARYAAPLFITNSGYTLYSQVDILLIGALLGTSAVGFFSAPLRLAIPLGYVGQAVANSVAPRQARTARDDARVDAFQTSLRWLVIFQAALLAPLIVWAEPIVRLFLGSDFVDSVDVLRVVSVYIFLRGLGPLITTTVNYLGQATRRIPIVLAALVVNVAIDLVLLPWIGVVGAAIGTAVAYALYVPAHFVVCRRELGLSTRPLAATLARAFLAAVAMGAVLFTIGTDTLSAPEWVLGGAAGTLVFAAVLLVTREVSTSEALQGSRIVANGISRLRQFVIR
jgi:O-antigen/teichoic acid export membrane protein